MSYESSVENGLNGMCWLKTGISTEYMRPKKWIVGIHKADLAMLSIVPDWFQPETIIMPPASVWSSAVSTSIVLVQRGAPVLSGRLLIPSDYS